MKKKKIFSLTCQGAFLNSRGVVDTELTGSFEKDWIQPTNSLTIISFYGGEKFCLQIAKLAKVTTSFFAQ